MVNLEFLADLSSQYLKSPFFLFTGVAIKERFAQLKEFSHLVYIFAQNLGITILKHKQKAYLFLEASFVFKLT